jgi:hypothetical protein
VQILLRAMATCIVLIQFRSKPARTWIHSSLLVTIPIRIGDAGYTVWIPLLESALAKPCQPLLCKHEWLSHCAWHPASLEACPVFSTSSMQRHLGFVSERQFRWKTARVLCRSSALHIYVKLASWRTSAQTTCCSLLFRPLTFLR